MPANPRLLKKLANPATVAAAGRKAILREELNSIRSDIRNASAGLLGSRDMQYVPTYCAALRELLLEYEALAEFMLNEPTLPDNKENDNADQA